MWSQQNIVEKLFLTSVISLMYNIHTWRHCPHSRIKTIHIPLLFQRLEGLRGLWHQEKGLSASGGFLALWEAIVVIWETEIPTAVNVIGSTFVGLVLTTYIYIYIYIHMIFDVLDSIMGKVDGATPQNNWLARVPCKLKQESCAILFAVGVDSLYIILSTTHIM